VPAYVVRNSEYCILVLVSLTGNQTDDWPSHYAYGYHYFPGLLPIYWVKVSNF